MRAREAEAVTLDAASVEAISRRVAELLRGAPLPGEVDAQAVARALGVERDWVYAHADEIGAIRLGNGPKARLRFDLDTVAERLRVGSVGSEPSHPESRNGKRGSRPRRRSSMGTNLGLLPIKGRPPP